MRLTADWQTKINELEDIAMDSTQNETENGA